MTMNKKYSLTHAIKNLKLVLFLFGESDQTNAAFAALQALAKQYEAVFSGLNDVQVAHFLSDKSLNIEDVLASFDEYIYDDTYFYNADTHELLYKKMLGVPDSYEDEYADAEDEDEMAQAMANKLGINVQVLDTVGENRGYYHPPKRARIIRDGTDSFKTTAFTSGMTGHVLYSTYNTHRFLLDGEEQEKAVFVELDAVEFVTENKEKEADNGN